MILLPPDQLALPEASTRSHVPLLTVLGILPRRRRLRSHACGEQPPSSELSSETIERIAGATQLQVTAGEPGFAEEVLERVQSHPDIAAAAPRSSKPS